MRGWNFDTPRFRLLLAARLAQQVPIAAAHQRKTSLHQTDGPIAEIVEFSRPARGYAWRRIERRQSRVSIAVHSRIECAKGQRQSVAPCRRQGVDWWTGLLAAERAPESSGGMRPHLEIIFRGNSTA
jgi:hypothetical protein